MKISKKSTKLIVIILMIAILVGITNNFVLAETEKSLRLEYFRYINGNRTDGYALNTVGTGNHHPIYQIMSSDNKTNFYCLNATAGNTWTNGTVGTSVVYKGNNGKPYNLEDEKDTIAGLTEDVYKNVVKNNYDQIIWLLDNMYIPGDSKEENLSNKRALLKKAGIDYTTVDAHDMNGKPLNELGYRYVKKGEDSYKFVSNQGKMGYFYYDEESNYQAIEIPDEIIESVQQSAIWYFTNYINNNPNNDTTYNAYVDPSSNDGKNWLYCSNGKTNINTNQWEALANLYKKDTNIPGTTADTGAWYQEIATILYDYLIDTARTYTVGATENKDPLSIELQTSEVSEKNLSGANYYVIGPITITENNEKAYTINEKFEVKDGEDIIDGVYISDSNGNRQNDKTVRNYIDEEESFYITVPKASVKGNNLKVSFEGSYQTVEKALWTTETGTEQPIVEVTPKSKIFPLEVTATINKKFDLALRKIIKNINGKIVINNEKGQDAGRIINYEAENIFTEGTAIYKHRKDPVVVKKDDVITYSISIYNEGDIAGYASEIKDRLPEGLEIVGGTTGTVTGTYTSLEGKTQNATYEYTFDKESNTITLKNKTNHILEAYNNGEKLACETIDIQCKVTLEPSISRTYLTNIAYISKEYNQELGQEVTSDRDSSTERIPEAQQKREEDTYSGYHGGNNNNGENTKNVYNDGTNNDDYFPGREDDDDFEIVVVEPEEFDMALQKYISQITSEGITKVGRQGPTINTQKLAEGRAETADYKLDKSPILVESGDYVTYTFEVYNEGEVDGFINKITDNIPIGLQFVKQKNEDGKTIIVTNSDGTSSEIEVDNNTYALIASNKHWTVDTAKDNYNNESTISIICDVDGYLDETSQDKLLSAYSNDADAGYNGSGLDSIYVTVVLRVSASNGKSKEIRNEAAITEAQDTKGNKQDEEGSKLKDRDSQVNRWLGKDGDKNYQDDEDYDRIILKKVDLALIKFIAAVSDDINIEDGEYLTPDKNKGSETNPYNRAPSIDSSKLKDGSKTDADYKRIKDALELKREQYVLYNIRVYNEGETDVYAGEVTDYLPNYLDYVSCNFNDMYGWQQGSDGKTITTTYLGYNDGNNKDNLLKAFDKENDNEKGSGLDYKDLQVLCRINDEAPSETKFINSAAITKYEDKEGNNLPEDEDSNPEDLKNDEKNKEQRYQDDDDWEVVKVKPTVDLALTKFIVAVSEDVNIENGEYLTPNKNVGSKENPYDRATSVNSSELKAGTKTDAEYEMVKTPLLVEKNSYILYNIRVYNEGETNVYAGEVTDYLPDYLDYVDCEFNKNYGWIQDKNDSQKITTTYLGYNDGNNIQNLLKAFDKQNDDGKGSGLDYRDLQVLCKVNDNTPTEKKLVNSAAITKYEDEEGKDLPEDEDSKPDDLPDDEKNKEERHEDDDDWEVVEVKPTVDLALTKFIVAVSEDINIENGEYLTPNKNVGNKENPYDRADSVNSSELKAGTKTDAEYNRVKDPLVIEKNSYVLYNIRVYNEGETDVYAGEVTDYLPDYLDFVSCEFNDKYGWKQGSDGRTITTTYLGYNEGNNEANLLKAFDKQNDDGKGSGLDYRDLQVLCKLNDNTPTETKLVNSAAITKYEDENGKDIPEDVDSKPEDLPDDEKNKEERHEDDDDWEVVQVKEKKVDLALTKFIAAVSEDANIENGEYLTANKNVGSKDNPYDRAPSIDSKELKAGTKTDADYKRVKTPLVVPAQSYVLYDIRVYNEGETDVYAGEVTDYLPDYLDYVSCEFNDKYGWKQESDGKTIKTTYLGYNEGNNTDNLLKAFDKENDDEKGSGLDYRDLQILCKVNDKAPTATNLVNSAEITKYEDEKGKEFPKDVDSESDNIKDKNKEERYEDDDDWEVVLIKTFDLSLLKYVSTVYVTEDGKTTVTQTGNTGDDSKDIMPKVEIHRKKVNSTIVKFGYTIKITNEGDIAGYAKEITDYVPSGLKFYEEDNEGWTDEGNNVISTRLLENTLLQPGESAQVTVIFRWINGSDNLGQKINIAEISEDYNDENVPDRDSTPDNKFEGEDDIDDAPVLLSISTGIAHNFIMYATYGLVILIILGIGITAIKKFVL